MTPKYSIVAVVKDQGKHLGTFYRRTTALMKHQQGETEWIFVDNGSGDDSLERLQDIALCDPKVRFIQLSRPFSFEGAVLAGLETATGSVVILADVSCAEPPELIPEFVKKWEQGYGLVYAEHLPSQTSFRDRMETKLHGLLTRFSSNPIPAASGDFCLMDRQLVETVLQLSERSGYFRGWRHWAGFKQIGVPVESLAVGERVYRRRLKDTLRLAWEGLLQNSSLPITAPLGMAWLIFLFLMGGMGAQIWMGNFDFRNNAIFLLFAGQFLLIAVVIGYLRRLLTEARHRPRYVEVRRSGENRPRTRPRPSDLSH